MLIYSGEVSLSSISSLRNTTQLLKPGAHAKLLTALQTWCKSSSTAICQKRNNSCKKISSSFTIRSASKSFICPNISADCSACLLPERRVRNARRCSKSNWRINSKTTLPLCYAKPRKPLPVLIKLWMRSSSLISTHLLLAKRHKTFTATKMPGTQSNLNRLTKTWPTLTLWAMALIQQSRDSSTWTATLTSLR